MPNMMVLAAAEGATTLDFSDAFTTALQGIQTDFVKYALIAIPIGLAIWAGPQVIKIVMRFFKSLTH